MNSGQMEPMEEVEAVRLDTHLEAEEGQPLAAMEMMVAILPLKIEAAEGAGLALQEEMGLEGQVHLLAMRQVVRQGQEAEEEGIGHPWEMGVVAVVAEADKAVEIRGTL